LMNVEDGDTNYGGKCKTRAVSASGLILADDRLITAIGTGDVTLTLPTGYANGTGVCQAIAVKNGKTSGNLTIVVNNTGTDKIYPYSNNTGITSVNVPSTVCMQLMSSSNTEWITLV